MASLICLLVVRLIEGGGNRAQLGWLIFVQTAVILSRLAMFSWVMILSGFQKTTMECRLQGRVFLKIMLTQIYQCPISPTRLHGQVQFKWWNNIFHVLMGKTAKSFYKEECVHKWEALEAIFIICHRFLITREFKKRNPCKE